MLPRVLAIVLLLSSIIVAGPVEMVWPTPAATSESWRPSLDTLQATASGEPESGGFGCVRSNGYRFHEGIDIKALRRDSRGEASDEIYAAMDGVVRHINSLSGESNYGRYIVIEHPDTTPAVYTLYAHLSKIAPGLRQGDNVRRGQVIGTMGRSSGGSAIPRDRAHLHFEIGLWLTRDFQSWYSWKKFGSPNQHGWYNGMNLMGFDAGDFFRQWKSGKISGIRAYIDSMETAVRVRIATTRTPDFIQRYPSLQTKERGPGLLGGWEIRCNASGLPFQWTPLDPRETAGMKQGEIVIIETNAALLRKNHCKDLVTQRRGSLKPGKDLNTVLELLFGLR
jgi:murein DD-endopeptidase MepM/ murein hydrolase activator NlpD